VISVHHVAPPVAPAAAFEDTTLETVLSAGGQGTARRRRRDRCTPSIIRPSCRASPGTAF